MDKIICPVPTNQIPLNELNNIKNSWIISWPLQEKSIFYRKLIYSWIFINPIILIISYGSDYLKHNIFELTLTSFSVSLLLPILLLFRQWLSWIYIYKRLNSEKIEYEESGWYDGQVWEKPIDWRAKDLLIAQHQIKPVLNHLRKIILPLILTIISSLGFIILRMNW